MKASMGIFNFTGKGAGGRRSPKTKKNAAGDDNYHLTGDEDDFGLANLATIVVYNFWTQWWPWPPTVPNFVRGQRRPDHVDPLIWGGLYAMTHPARRTLDFLLSVRLALYAVGVLLVTGILPLFAQDRIERILAAVCFGVGYMVNLFALREFDKDMRVVVANRLNPLLHKAGYSVKYGVEHDYYPFRCKPTTRNLYLFTKKNISPKSVAKGLDTLWNEVMTVSLASMTAQPETPVKVYMHAPWYRIAFLWKCGLKHHDFFHDAQPKALQSLHPFVWGNLVESFTLPRMEQFRERRNSGIKLLAFVAVFGFFVARDGFLTGWIMPWILALAAVGVYFYYEAQLRNTAINEGHDGWLAACKNWQEPASNLGWILEYHHKDEQDGTWRNCLLCGGDIASDFVRFVPNRVPNV